MNKPIYRKLHNEGLLSDLSLEKVKTEERNRLFSVHWELKTILYLGILLLTGGLGILIYKNIDTIGHQAILALIGAICIGSFYYCEKQKLPFSRSKVAAPNSFFDYILLLGCLTFVTFISYLQIQYTTFGNAIGSATFIPMIVLFFCAYYFDHLGVLSMAITNLAAWMGVAVTPLNILSSNDLSDIHLIYAGLLLGLLLILAGRLSETKNIKQHFAFTYSNFGMNILFISCLAAMFHFDAIYFLWFLLLAGSVFYFYRQARLLNSFYFILMLSLYGYIGISYVVIRIFDSIRSLDQIALLLFYFIFSSIATGVFLIKTNKKLKSK